MVGEVSDRDARECASRLIVGFLYDARTRFIPERWVYVGRAHAFHSQALGLCMTRPVQLRRTIFKQL